MSSDQGRKKEITMPRVSVIMPCYNEEKNVKEAVESILNQTFTDFELIIIDDCSTDGTFGILEYYEKKDKRVRILKNSSNIGVAASANIGIKNSYGTYIARMDADDFSLPERLEKQYRYMERNQEVVLLGTFCKNVDGLGSKKLVSFPQEDEGIREYMKRDNPFIQSSTMFKKIVSGGLVQYRDMQVYEDYDLWIRLGSFGEYHILGEVLVERKEDDNFKSRKVWKGLDKKQIYRMRLGYQIEAMKKFGFSFKGSVFCMKTVLSIFVSYVRCM